MVDQPDGVVYKYDWATKALVAKFLPLTSCGDPQGNAAFGLAVDRCGLMYLTGSEIMVLDPSGKLISRFGVTGNQPGQLAAPLDIAVEPVTGDIFEADYSNARVQRFRLGAGDLCSLVSVAVNPPGDSPHVSVAPNPFRTRTWVRFALGGAGDVDVSVYDVAGRLVRDLHHGRLPAGLQEFAWDGASSTGARAEGGIYFVRVRASGQLFLTKVIQIH